MWKGCSSRLHRARIVQGVCRISLEIRKGYSYCDALLVLVLVPARGL